MKASTDAHAHLQEMIDQTQNRIARVESGKAQEVIDEELLEYPILPRTSKMHYFSTPCTESDMPGYRARLKKWQKWSEKGFSDLSNPGNKQRALVMVNFAEMCNIFGTKERMWSAQVEFTDMVIEHAAFDVLAYWYRGLHYAYSENTLNTLCSRTARAAMLVRKVDPVATWQHHYDELVDMGSQFHQKAKYFSEMHQQLAGLGHIQTELSVIYMLDYTPKDVFKVRALFPRVRIVGIAVPGPDNDKEMLKVLLLQQKQVANK